MISEYSLFFAFFIRRRGNAYCFSVFGAAILVWLSGCASQISPDAPTLLAPAAMVMETETVSRGDVISFTVHYGTVQLASYPLFFDVEGFRFDNYYVNSGDRVTEGQLLASLSTEHIHDRIEDMEERIAHMQRIYANQSLRQSLVIDAMMVEHAGLLRRAAESFDMRLFDQAARLEGQIQEDQLALSQAQELHNQEIEEARRLLSLVREELQGTELFAPHDGIVTCMILWNGTLVTSSLEIIYLAKEEDIFVQYMGQTHNHFITRSEMEDLLFVRAFIDGVPFELEHVELTQVQLLYYAMRNIRNTQPPHLLPLRFVSTGEPLPLGAFVTLHFYYVYERDVLRLPVTAVHMDNELGFYVYLLEDGQQHQRFFEGVETATYVAIHSGLEEGDVVVVRH